MRAAAAVLLTVACSGAGPAAGGAAVDAGVPACAAYLSHAETYGYCLYKQAAELPDAAAVERVCSAAGSWEAACRHAFVARWMRPESGFSTEQLLSVCKGGADCAFELLDFRPLDDTVAQVARCEAHTGPFVGHCVGHALQRWYFTEPDAAGVEAMLALPTAQERPVAFFVGAVVACRGIGACGGAPARAAACETAVEAFRDNPLSCPRDTRRPLGAGSGPGPDGAPGAPAPGTEER